MNNSAAKVGEIFREAGTAFNKLSEMTLMLQPMDDSSQGGKWSDEEVEMLRGCINRFAVELNKISQHIKNRTMSHLRRLLEMDSGILQDISHSPPSQTQPLQQHPQLLPAHHLQGLMAQQLPVYYLQEIQYMQIDSMQQQPPVSYAREQQACPYSKISLQPLDQSLQHQVSAVSQQLPAYYPPEQHIRKQQTNISLQSTMHYLQQQVCEQNTNQQPPTIPLREQYPLQLDQPPVDYVREQWTQQSHSIPDPITADYLRDQRTRPFHHVPEPLPAAYMRNQYPQPLRREQPPAEYLRDYSHQQLLCVTEESRANYLGKQQPVLRHILKQPPANYANEQQSHQMHSIPTQQSANYVCEQQPQQMRSIPPEQSPANYLGEQQPVLRHILKQPPANYAYEQQPHQMHSVPTQQSADYICEQQTQQMRRMPERPLGLSEVQPQQMHSILEKHPANFVCEQQHQTPQCILQQLQQLHHILKCPSENYLQEQQPQQMHDTAELSSANYLDEQQPELRRLLRRPSVKYLSENQPQQMHRALEQSSKDFVSCCEHRILENIVQQTPSDYLSEQQLPQMHSSPEQSSANYLRDQGHIPMSTQAEKLTQTLSINMYSQGFPENSKDDDDLIRNFNPSIVPPMPPANIMQEDIIQPPPTPEFDDIQDPIVHTTLLLVPGLIRLLDFDTNQCTNSTDSSEANIGTLHAELPSHVGNQEATTDAYVRKEAHFSLRQAKETWSHVSGPVDLLENLSTGPVNKCPCNFTNTGPSSCISCQKCATTNLTNNQVISVVAPPGKPTDNAFKTDDIRSIESKERPVAKFSSNGAFSEIFNNKISIVDPNKSAEVPASIPIDSSPEVAKNIFFVESEEKPVDGSSSNGAFSSIFRQKNSTKEPVIDREAPSYKQVSSAVISPDKSEEKPDRKCLCNGPFSCIFRPNSSTNDPKSTGSVQLPTSEPVASSFESIDTINHIVSEGRPVGPFICHNSSADDVLIGEPIITSSDSCDAICINENQGNMSISHCFHSISATKFPSFFGAPIDSITEKERTLREICYFLYKVPFKSIFNKLLATTIASGLADLCPVCITSSEDGFSVEGSPSNAPHTNGSSEVADEKPTDTTQGCSSSVRTGINEKALQSNAQRNIGSSDFSCKQPASPAPGGFSPMTDANNNKDLLSNTPSTNGSSDLSKVKSPKLTPSSLSSVSTNINKKALPSNARRLIGSSDLTSELSAITTLGCFSSVEADPIKEDLPSNAPSTKRTKGRGRPRRPRKVDCTERESAVLTLAALPLAESTPGPSQTRFTRSRRNQACNNDEAEVSAPKKRSRKKTPTVTTPGPITRASRKNKQLK